MKKKSPKEVLKGFTWVYIFFAVVAFIFAIVMGCMKEIPEEIVKAVPKDLDTDPRTYFVTYFVLCGLFELWFCWLLRRFINGKSKGTFYMVLLIIGVVGNAITLFVNSGVSTMNLVLDAVILYFLIKARKEENN